MSININTEINKQALLKALLFLQCIRILPNKKEMSV